MMFGGQGIGGFRLSTDMNERFGLLFSDGSILVLPEGTSVEVARKEAEEHDQGDDEGKTEVVLLDLILKRTL
jgi:hypothetical protein